MRIQLTETNVPKGGVRFQRKEFRTMPIFDIEEVLEADFKHLEKEGYNAFTIHRATGCVSVRKIKVKTMQDIIETDRYKILYIDK